MTAPSGFSRIAIKLGDFLELNAIKESLNVAALDPERLLPFATELADTARGLLRHWFRHKLAVALKADQSPVTIADREIEVAIR